MSGSDDPKMSTSAPVLRPQLPGSRGNSASRPPRLGLAIPPSPSAKPVNPDTHQTELGPIPKPAPPSLKLATPMGSSVTPHEGRRAEQRGRLPPLQVGTLSTGGGSSDTSANSRSGSSGEMAAGSHSITEFLRQSRSGEQLSAASSSHSNVGADGGHDELLPDLEKLSLERGRPLDADDLDDAGWRAASRDGRIEELGGLGEGSGGAVTRCKLRGGGKTVFALKVSLMVLIEASAVNVADV